MSFSHKELLFYSKTLNNYARKLTGNEDDAQDLVQDTIVRALRAQDKYSQEDGANLGSWLTVIMRNLFLTGIRRDRRIVPMPEGLLESQPVSANQLDRVIVEEALRALELIPAPHREVYKAIVLDEMSYEEASEEFDMPIGTIKSKVCRAKDYLEEYFGDRYEQRRKNQR